MKLITKQTLVRVLIIVAALLWVSTQVALAAPLIFVPVTVTQPDGQVLHLFASGDEYYNWLHDAKGYTIIQDPKTGYYVFADLVEDVLVPTQYTVGSVNPAAVGLTPNLNISPEKMETIRQAQLAELDSSAYNASDAPKTGTITNLVVFVRFSGEAEFTNPLSFYTGLFNDSASGANSMRNYYLEVSYNVLTIGSNFYPTPGATVVSYQDGHTRNYYRPYNVTTNPEGYPNDTERRIREHTLLRDAVVYVNGLGQFPAGAVIDGDNDGIVDSIAFIVSGSPDGWNNLLWPHKWNLSTYAVTINGRLIDEYAFQLDSVLETGVLAHEMFHVLGAPDLYHYSGDGLQPVGSWDVMEADLNPPQHMGCYMKYKYGTWISNIPTITEPGTYTLNPLISSTNNCYQIASPYSTDEFFLVEYRREASSPFENSLPGTGLLVYRIDTLENGNAGGPPDEVYILRPGGTITVNGTINEANFSSSVGRDHVNSVTDPTSFLTDGSAGGLSLCNITASGGTISFDYGNCGAARFSPTSYDFGDQIAGTTSAPITFTLTNTGTVAFAVGELTVSSQFTITNDLCSYQTIAASSTCTFRVAFAPTTAGAKSGMAIIPSDNDNTPDVVSLTGNGTGLQSGPTFVVNSNADTNDGGCYILAGGCTLREALLAASAGNTITFDASLSGGTISLSSTLTLVQDVTIDASALTTAITITGDTDDNGVGDVRVFMVNAGVAATLNDLVITRGYDSNLGGAIFNSGSLTVTNTTFTENSVANTSGHWGGAIYSVGPVVLDGCTFRGNNAYNGGAIAINTGGALNVANTTFSNNNSAVSSGGAIYSVAAVTVTDSVFDGNSASSGGAIRLPAGSSLNATNTTFSGNTTTGSGAAIYNSGTLTVTNSTLASNTAGSYAGGIYNSGTLNVTNSTLSGNSGNVTSGWGGAIYNGGSTTVANSTFSANSVYVGGGIANSGGTLSVTNATFSANSASFGGGIYNTGTQTLMNTILANATSGGDCRNAGTVAAASNNLIENTGVNACGLTNGTNGNIIGFDPSLGALQNNGGTTQTLMPGSNSLAIDAGNITSCGNSPVSDQDQRGQDRNDYQCDIGSVEVKMADSSTIIRSISATGAYTFGPTMVKIDVNNTGGCLTGVTVQRYDTNHPNASAALQTGHWWEITPAGCTSGFNVNLTLPADFTPDANDKVCRWNPGSGWDCAMATFTSNSITRNGVTGFSQWTAGNNAGPTAIALTQLTAVNAAGNAGSVFVWLGALAIPLLSAAGLLRFTARRVRRR